MIWSLLAKTFDVFALSLKDRNAVNAHRERIYEELGKNLRNVELFLKKHPSPQIEPQYHDEFERLINLLSRDRFDKMSDAGYSPSQFFPEFLSLPDKGRAKVGDGTRQYLLWMKRNTTVGDLLRRYHERIETIKIELETEKRVNVGYLRFILSVLRKSIVLEK